MTVREGWNAGEVEKYLHGQYDRMMNEKTAPEMEIRRKRTVNLPLNVREIEFMGAEDRNYSKDKTGSGNIYNNSAEKFQVAMLGKNGKIAGSERKLVRDEKHSESYQLEEGKKGYLFETFMSDEELFYVDAKTKIRNMNAKLGIRPTDSAHAYPGDDLVLKFKVKTPYGDCIVKTSEKDYIAVYDKKMLWRANLYIDEVAGDWNNVHPWNTEDKNIGWYGENEWLDENAAIKGGQVEIISCTYWDGNKKIEKSVAYGWGCRDALTKYNNYLKKESDLIKKGRDELNQNQNEGNNNSQNINVLQNLTSDPAFNTLIWNESTGSTYAPSDKWENYLFTKRTKETTTDNKAYYKYGTSTATDTQHKYYIDEHTYIPGLSTYWAYGPETEGYEATQATNHYSIGTDCSGLVESAIDYGSFYKANTTTNKESENKLGCAGLKSNSFEIRAAGKWRIEDKEESAENKEEERILLSHAVPGDIFVKSSSPGAHIVIIQDIKYSGTDCKINDLSNIDIIQAGKGENADWQVMKGDFKTAKYGDHPLNTFELRRLNVK